MYLSQRPTFQLLSAFCNIFLLGILTVQVCEYTIFRLLTLPTCNFTHPSASSLVPSHEPVLYHTAFQKDRLLIQTSIYAVYISELAQTVLLVKDVFENFAKSFGDTAALNRVGLFWLSIPVLSGIGMCLNICLCNSSSEKKMKSHIHLSGSLRISNQRPYQK